MQEVKSSHSNVANQRHSVSVLRYVIIYVGLVHGGSFLLGMAESIFDFRLSLVIFNLIKIIPLLLSGIFFGDDHSRIPTTSEKHHFTIWSFVFLKIFLVWGLIWGGDFERLVATYGNGIIVTLGLIIGVIFNYFFIFFIFGWVAKLSIDEDEKTTKVSE